MEFKNKNTGIILTILFLLISFAVVIVFWVVLTKFPTTQDHDQGSLIIIILTLIFTYFVATPIILDIVGAYAFEHHRLGEITGLFPDNPELLADLIRDFEKTELNGVRNLTRAMIALGIILIIGVAVGFIIHNIYNISSNFYNAASYNNDTFAKIVIQNHEKDVTILSNILGNILGILAGAVAAITGFFFGSRNQERPEPSGNKLDNVNSPRLTTASDWFHKGNDLAAKGEYDKAILSYDEAIRLYPNYAKAWYNKGIALRRLGRDTEADTVIAKAKELGYAD